MSTRPIPTVHEVLQCLRQSTVISKQDLKCGYYQLELYSGSCRIITFTTHCGLLQHECFMFGIRSSPEGPVIERITLPAAYMGVLYLFDIP